MGRLKGSADKKPRQVSTSRVSAAERRQLFAEAYLANGHNATNAAIDVGLGPQAPGLAGHRMLRHADVQAIIATRSKVVAELAELNTENWAHQLRALAFADVRDLFNPDGTLRSVMDLPANIRPAIQSIKVDRTNSNIVEYRFWSKTQALETIARHLGLFEKDNLQLRSNIQVNVVMVG